MAEKAAVINALNEVSSAFGVLKKAQGHAQDAIAKYAAAINNTNDPSPLLAQFPSIFGAVGDAIGVKSGSPEVGEGETKKRKRGPNKEKKVKDPNAPKRPPSAYIEYQNSVREEFRKQYSDLPYSEVLKKIGLVWQGMSDDDKKPWHEITDAKKDVYNESKKAYEEAHGGAPPATPAATQEDGKPAPKKRGRKSNAEKALIEAAKAGTSGDIPVEDPKEKKKAKATPAKKVAAPAAEESSDDSDSGSDDDSEDDSEDDSDEEEEEEPEPEPVKAKKDKHKSKKSKH
ncbi:hypothetical protein JCM6882_001871 [Rhodosporidiobolus microsporus]